LFLPLPPFSPRPQPLYLILPLHDALPISRPPSTNGFRRPANPRTIRTAPFISGGIGPTTGAPNSAVPPGSMTRRPGNTTCICSRSEEHTSELQSREKLVWRLLLEKKNCSL